jgi:hypothetical protein
VTQTGYRGTSSGVEELGAIFKENIASFATDSLSGKKVSVSVQNGTGRLGVDI